MNMLTLFIQVARNLRPDPPNSNPEYVRGQAELICDVLGLSMDDYKEVVIESITKD